MSLDFIRERPWGLSLADGSMGYDELLAWIREHAMLQEKSQATTNHKEETQ